LECFSWLAFWGTSPLERYVNGGHQDLDISFEPIRPTLERKVHLERQQPEASQSKALIENVDIHNHPDINHDVAKTEDDRIQIQQSDLNLSAKRNRKDRPGFHKNANSSTVIRPFRRGNNHVGHSDPPPPLESLIELLKPLACASPDEMQRAFYELQLKNQL